MNRLTRFSMTLLLGLTLFTPGCFYVKHRIMDMSDVVDIKYGFGVGLGAKVESTNWLGVGLGWGVMTNTREWYGRRSIVRYDQEFLQFIIAGRDGTKRPWGEPGEDGTDFYNIVFPVNLNAVTMRGWPFRPPLLEWFRSGFEVIVPGANFGLYVNGGEILDFLLGIFTIDIADDDGVPKSAQYNDHFARDVEPGEDDDE